MIKREDFLIKDETKDNYVITDANGKNEHSVLKIDAAVETIYLDKDEKAMVALKDKKGIVYLGKKENYYYTPINSDSEPIAFYDNSNNSLEFISDNEAIFDILSQQYFRRMSDIMGDNYYTKKDIEEWKNVEYKFNKFTKENFIDFLNKEEKTIPWTFEKNYVLPDGNYFHFHLNEEGYYYSIYNNKFKEIDGGLMEYDPNIDEGNQTLRDIRERLSEFSGYDITSIGLKEINQDELDEKIDEENSEGEER